MWHLQSEKNVSHCEPTCAGVEIQGNADEFNCRKYLAPEKNIPVFHYCG
jgi:hypothetical protein